MITSAMDSGRRRRSESLRVMLFLLEPALEGLRIDHHVPYAAFSERGSSPHVVPFSRDLEGAILGSAARRGKIFRHVAEVK